MDEFICEKSIKCEKKNEWYIKLTHTYHISTKFSHNNRSRLIFSVTYFAFVGFVLCAVCECV